jgi:hypothetical protein
MVDDAAGVDDELEVAGLGTGESLEFDDRHGGDEPRDASAIGGGDPIDPFHNIHFLDLHRAQSRFW